MNGYFVKYDVGVNSGYAELLTMGRSSRRLRILSNDTRRALAGIVKNPEDGTGIFAVGRVVDVGIADLNDGFLPKVEDAEGMALCHELVYYDVMRKNQELQYDILLQFVSGGSGHEQVVRDCMRDIAFNTECNFVHMGGTGYDMYARVLLCAEGSMTVRPVHVDVYDDFFRNDIASWMAMMPVAGCEAVYSIDDAGRLYGYMEPVFDPDVETECGAYSSPESMADNRKAQYLFFDQHKDYVISHGSCHDEMLRAVDSCLDRISMYGKEQAVGVDNLPRKRREPVRRGNEFDGGDVSAQGSYQFGY